MRKRYGVVVAIVVAMFVGVGCGDDDEETTPAASSAPPTKEEFIEQADQICADGDAEIEQAAQETFSQGRPSPEEEEAFITDTAIPSIQTQVEGLSALTPPEGDEEDVAAIVDAAESALAEVEEDPAAITEEGGRNDPFAEATKLAEDYGITECK